MLVSVIKLVWITRLRRISEIKWAYRIRGKVIWIRGWVAWIRLSDL